MFGKKKKLTLGSGLKSPKEVLLNVITKGGLMPIRKSCFSRMEKVALDNFSF